MENYNDNVTEIWKKVPGYSIQVSNLGNLLRIPRIKKYKKLVPNVHEDRDGYLHVNVITDDGIQSDKAIHRLVALAFIPNDDPEHKTCVNHKDSNRKNNRVDNLEWVSPRENVRHSIYNGNRKLVYEVPHQSTLTQYQISQIKILREIYTVKEISKLFNVKYTTLKNIIRKQKQSKILDNQQPNPKYVVGEVQRV